MMASSIVPVILCGGDGARLWPASGAGRPKPFLPLLGARSSFQETVLRVANKNHFAVPFVLVNEKHAALAARQLAEIGQDATIVIEPARRDTAAAIALGANIVAQTEPDSIIAFMAADHVIRQVDLFVADCLAAASAAEDDWIVTFGITPTSASTAYGYIHAGLALPNMAGTHAVDRFREKPDVDLAQQFIDEGCLWNSGNFVAKASVMKREIANYAPDIGAVVEKAVEGLPAKTGNIQRLPERPFSTARRISIDHAVMEKTPNAAVLKAQFDWSDIGSWESLFELGNADASNNVTHGNVVLQDSQDCYARSDGPLVAVKGLKNTCVVASGDAVLVMARDAAGDLKSLVHALDPATASAQRVYRPWGYYETVTTGDAFLVKRIVVDPGARLSDQKHAHRDEHWVCVSGEATAMIDMKERLFVANDSIYIPAGVRHRIYNHGPTPVEFVEVQYGTHLSEDDIVRYDDDYGRVVTEVAVDAVKVV